MAETEILKQLYIALKKAQEKILQFETAQHEPIAIIGMGCRFPGGANDPTQYWNILKNGIDTTTSVPADRWDAAAYYDPDPDVPGKMYTTQGGFINLPLDRFDAEFFNLSPKETNSLDPQHRLLLEVSWEALENAGIDVSTLLKSQTGVFIGISSDDYTFAHRHSGDYKKINAYAMSGSTLSTASGRISYVFGLEGPSMAIDTACSSSLIALHLACQSLRAKDSDLALVGGVNLILTPEKHICFSKLQALSPDGRCKTFDASANGYARGEGCGVVVLKRLSDAVKDGDRILAVVKGTAINQDGKSSGLTVPNTLAQQKVMRQALENARVEPAEITYIEAHGTGTALGDPIEIEAIGKVFKANHTFDLPLLIGSVKTNVGHLEPCAGMAGLIKLVQCLQYEAIPPSLHFSQPNPHIPWDELPIKIPTQLTPWPRSDKPRIAGISAFGFSGTNAHVIIAEAPVTDISPSERERAGHLLTLSAKNEQTLSELGTRYVNYLSADEITDIADICYTANVGRYHFDHRLAITGKTKAEIAHRLSTYLSDPTDAGIGQSGIIKSPDTRVAFLFTGQGSQYPGMGYQLYETQPTFRKALDRCDEILRSYLETPLLEVLYPKPDKSEIRNPKSEINMTAYTQPALFALGYALAKLWLSWGIEPTVVMGHSVGEYVAACIAGVFSLEDGLKLIAERGRLMQTLPRNGEMMSVLADEKRVQTACQPYSQDVSIAAINGPQSIVIAGRSEAVQAVKTALETEGIKTKTLQVSHAFHSPLMEPMLADFRRVASAVKYSRPRTDIISNVTGQRIGDEIATSEYWCRHVRQPVKFAQSMETLYQLGYEIFLEIGPKPVLLGMGRQIIANCEFENPKSKIQNPKSKILWLPSLRFGRDDWQVLLQSLGELYVRGVPVDWSGFDQDYSRRKVELPTYPFQRQRFWMDVSGPVCSNRFSDSAPTNKETALHPLLGKKFQSPLLKEMFFESWFSSETMPFLEDHRIFDELVVSGATHISLLLGASESAFGVEGCVLEDILFPQALVIPDSDGCTVQLAIIPENDTEAAFQLISLDHHAARNVWITHATGKILTDRSHITDSPTMASDFQEICARCPQEIIATELYQIQRQRHIQLGPSYQWMGAIRKGDHEAACQLNLPPVLSGVAEKYQLHPGLIDSCFGLLVSSMAIKEEETMIPFRIERVRFYRRPDRYPVYAYARLRHNQTGMQIGDVQLFEETGKIIAEFIGLEGRKVRREGLLRGLQKDFRKWFHTVTWQPKARISPSQPVKAKTPGRWLIFADQDGIGAELAELFEKQGDRYDLVSIGSTYVKEDETHYQVNPSEPEDFRRLLRDCSEENQLPYEGVIHLWSLNEQFENNSSLAALQHAQITGCASVLLLVQALVQTEVPHFPRLCLVTRGAQPVGTASVMQVQQSLLWGLGKVIALEHPDLRCLRLDLDPERDLHNIRSLYEEIRSPDPEDQVAWRAKVRYVPRLERFSEVKVSSSEDVKTKIRQDGSYLITGGTGALGLRVAQWLVEQGGRHLILTSRRGASDEAQAAINRLEQAGAEIVVVKADVSHQDDIIRLLETVNTSMPPLRGIIQAAGVLHDGVLRQQTWEGFRSVLKPKVEGAWNLHQLTRDLPLDFFICFSSMVSLIGSPAQGNYVAANTFMDVLMHHRRALGMPGLSINWGPWAETGMAASLEDRDQHRIASQGFDFIIPEDGMQILGELMLSDVAQIGVLPVDWSVFVQQFSQAEIPPFFEAFTPVTPRVAPKKPGLLDLLEKASVNEYRRILMSYIRSEIVSIMELHSPEQIQPRQRLLDMGMDSLMAVELGNRLQSAVGCSLRSTLVFDYPTIESLADYLLKDVLGLSPAEKKAETPSDVPDSALAEIEQMSEAEAEALLLEKVRKYSI
jgi:malonyl CoA-acyl carrier protein transacylase